MKTIIFAPNNKVYTADVNERFISALWTKEFFSSNKEEVVGFIEKLLKDYKEVEYECNEIPSSLTASEKINPVPSISYGALLIDFNKKTLISMNSYSRVCLYPSEIDCFTRRSYRTVNKEERLKNLLFLLENKIFIIKNEKENVKYTKQIKKLVKNKFDPFDFIESTLNNFKEPNVEDFEINPATGWKVAHSIQDYDEEMMTKIVQSLIENNIGFTDSQILEFNNYIQDFHRDEEEISMFDINALYIKKEKKQLQKTIKSSIKKSVIHKL